MKRFWTAIGLTAGILLLAMPVLAQTENVTGEGRAVITVFAKHGEMAPSISLQDVTAKVNGKDVGVKGWTPLTGAHDGLELVVLIDGGARNLGRQFDDIKQFIQGLRPGTKAAVGYMENGRAVLASPLSADHAQICRARSTCPRRQVPVPTSACLTLRSTGPLRRAEFGARWC